MAIQRPPSEPEFLLLITVGGADLRLVVPDRDPEIIAGIASRCVREFHQWCLDNPSQVSVRLRGRPQHEKGPSGGRRPEVDIDGTSLRVRGAKGEAKEEPRWPPDGPIELVAERLGELVGEVRARQRNRKLGACRAIVLFSTRRESGRDASGEPIAAATLLRGPLSEALGLSEGQVEESVILEERESLYERGPEGGDQLSTIAAARIDHTVRKLADANPAAQLILCDTGGLPEVKPVLLGACRLHGGPHRTRRLRLGEQERGAPKRTELSDPAASLETRWRVIALVEAGSIDAAAALALEDARWSKVEPWRRWVGDLAKVLRGQKPGDVARRFQDTAKLPKVVTLLADEQHSLLRCAMLIECSLRRQFVVEAIALTCSFVEAAMSKAAAKYLSEEQEHSCVNPEGRLVLRNLTKDALRELSRHVERQARRRNKDDLAAIEIDHEVRAQIPRLLRRRASGLARCLEQWEKARADRKIARARNQYIHSATTFEAARKDARALLIAEHEVWPEAALAPDATASLRFLGHPPVEEVLDGLEAVGGRAQFESLLRALRADLANHSFRPSDEDSRA